MMTPTYHECQLVQSYYSTAGIKQLPYANVCTLAKQTRCTHNIILDGCTDNSKAWNKSMTRTELTAQIVTTWSFHGQILLEMKEICTV